MLFDDVEVAQKAPEYIPPKKLGLFDYIRCITNKETLTDEELQGYEPFMVNRLLSGHAHYLPLIRKYANHTFIVGDKRMHYQMMCAIIPHKFVKLTMPLKKAVDHDERLAVYKALAENLELGKNDIREMEKFQGYEAIKEMAKKYLPRN